MDYNCRPWQAMKSLKKVHREIITPAHSLATHAKSKLAMLCFNYYRLWEPFNFSETSNSPRLNDLIPSSLRERSVSGTH